MMPRLLALAALLALTAPARAVVGGAPAGPGVAGSLAMVLAEGGGFCTAVVLAPDVLLTAAHCLAGPRRRLAMVPAAGAEEPTLIGIVAVVLHPGYAPDAAKRRLRSVDLALARLGRPLPPVLTPAMLGSHPGPAEGQAVRLAASGMAREGDPASAGVAREAALTAVEPYGPSALLLWASAPPGTLPPGRGACTGDSGGALLDASGAVTAIAAFAAGSGRARCGSLTQGVRLAPQRGWIDGTLKRWNAAATWR